MVTATEWKNWFGLRNHPDAEIHIQKLAQMMKEEYDKNWENVEELNEESVPLENVEENINMEVVPNVRTEDVADRTNEMIRSMRRDLHMNKKRFVNPYRAKHQMNEKRLERLRNIRVKKNSGLGLSQYL